MAIEDTIEGMIKDESAQTEAVKSLINVKDRVKGQLGSDIELKTDLSENDVIIHTGVDMLNRILQIDDFAKVIVTEDLVQIKERKLVSKDRKSRQEIVEVARNPDMNSFSNDGSGGSFVKKMFTPHKQ